MDALQRGPQIEEMTGGQDDADAENPKKVFMIDDELEWRIYFWWIMKLDAQIIFVTVSSLLSRLGWFPLFDEYLI